MNGETKITPRLGMAASLVPKCDKAADIGTDHGYLPIYLVQKGICRCAIAADINEGPLAAAKKNIAISGLSGKIETVLSDGLKNIDYADCVIAAGMGGDLITEILKGKKPEMKRFVLQPQRSFDKVRYYLSENGFEIKREAAVSEGRRMYCAFYAEYTGKKKKIGLAEALCGRKEAAENPEVFGRYMEYRRGIVMAALGSMEGAKDEKRKKQLEEEADIYREMAK